MCGDRGGRRAQTGFTLMEMILAIVVIGVGLAGVMLAFAGAVRGSADPVVQLQLLSVAEELLEEIQLKPFAAAANAAPATACARDTFNDIGDYAAFAADTPVCTIDGTAVAELSGITFRVSVQAAALSGVTNARRITVTVRRGADVVSLVGWRTDYAGS